MFAALKTSTASSGYQISRSLRFNSADSAYLNRTPASATNRKTWTWSGWLKRSNLGAFTYFFGASPDSFNNTFLLISFGSSDNLRIQDYQSGFTCNVQTTAVYRDVSAWYHVVIAIDTTQATAANRVRLYVNGVEVTAFSTATYPTQNTDLTVDNNVAHVLGYTSSTNNYNGYMTEVNFIDGQALTPSSFGETNAQTGVWQPKAYSGSYGTNGFYLNFSDNSNTTAATLGKDYSGNGNNWTPNNFSVTAGAGNDSLVDSPTSYGTDTGVGGTVRGNYATMNPLSQYGCTFANGNLDTTLTTTASPQSESGVSNFGVSSGKWYCEILSTGGSGPFIGIADASLQAAGRTFNSSSVWSYYVSGSKYNGGTATAYGASWTTNDVIGIALDMDAGTVTFYKNGASQGVAFSGLTGRSIVAWVSTGTGSVGEVITFVSNFGQRPFAYTAPSGYKALCTQNLPTPTIGATTATQAGKFFNTVTYTGTQTTQSVTGVGFQPDFVWNKDRSGPWPHVLTDAVRGVGKSIYTNSTDPEVTNDANGYLSAFNSDGFTLAGGLRVNASGDAIVAWNWKANGSGSTNTAGSITSTVSANTTSGFSVATFTTPASGAFTFGHGLGVAPSMVIAKSRSGTLNWVVYHSAIGATKYLTLNATSEAITLSSVWNDTAPTSTVVSSTAAGLGASNNYVAYCFAEVAGYSKFGSYTGNGSADGVFVYTGFRPAFVLIKQSSGSGGHWSLKDSARSPSNVALANLFPNLSNAETSEYDYDILSNGFKLRTTSITVNASGETYIYACFAQNPFKTSLAR